MLHSTARRRAALLVPALALLPVAIGPRIVSTAAPTVAPTVAPTAGPTAGLTSGPTVDPGAEARRPSLADLARRRDRELAERIVTASLVDGQAFDHLESLVAAAPHRLSGSPGAAAAVEWARKRMLEIGFDEVLMILAAWGPC